MKREFAPRDKYPVYYDEIDKLMVNSQILNGGSMRINTHTTLWDKENIKAQLLELCGEEDGYYLLNGKLAHAVIPSLLKRLAEMEKRFEYYKETCKNEGRKMPETMPTDMLTDFYKIKARITVAEEEENMLRKQLQKFENKEIAKDDSRVLEYGLQCVATFHGTRAEDPRLMNVIKEIDGQTVKQTKDGYLVIDDSRSPYTGMLVSDYRKLAEQWREQVRQKEANAFKLLCESYKEQGLRIPAGASVTGISPVPRSELPEFPKWAKKYSMDGSNYQQ